MATRPIEIGPKREVELIRTFYDTLEQPTDQWLRSVAEASERAFDGRLGRVTVAQVRVGPAGQFEAESVCASASDRLAFLAMHAAAPPALIKRLYHNGPVVALSAFLDSTLPPRIREWIERLSIEEVLGAHGLDPSGHGVCISWSGSEARAMNRSLRLSLERIAAHIGSAARLRRTGGAPEAYIAPDGKIMHAEGRALESSVQESLRQTALDIERSRMSDSEMNPAEIWQALVDGKWSMVEQFDSDGRRFFVARPNAPMTHASFALTAVERQVISYSALGHPLKVVAFDLGIAVSTVADVLRRALKKLGIRDRAALIELYGAVISPESE